MTAWSWAGYSSGERVSSFVCSKGSYQVCSALAVPVLPEGVLSRVGVCPQHWTGREGLRLTSPESHCRRSLCSKHFVIIISILGVDVVYVLVVFGHLKCNSQVVIVMCQYFVITNAFIETNRF